MIAAQMAYVNTEYRNGVSLLTYNQYDVLTETKKGWIPPALHSNYI